MPKKIDLTGQHFGEWTVLREATDKEKQYKNGAYWLCRCSCGTERIIQGQSLREGHSGSCGCKTSERLSISHKNKNCIDISGQRFGKLIVLERDFKTEQLHPSTHNTYWKCKCDCGNTISVMKSSLTSGTTTSCGCYRKEKAAKHLSAISTNNYIDETNNKYGLLTVLYKSPLKHISRAGVLWHCKCECGKEIDVLGIDLRNGVVSSCGCLRTISKGEEKIKKLLLNNHYLFVEQYPVNINGYIYKFDFAILKNNQLFYCIEFDGKQHFEPSNLFGGVEGYNDTQKRDNLKNQWCKENNIPLIRIPYTHLNDLTIKDLLLESSEYILK